MAVALAEIKLNERDGQLFVDKYSYNNSYPDHSEESYYRIWKETVPFDEWEELVNNTALDISWFKKDKIKTCT